MQLRFRADWARHAEVEEAVAVARAGSNSTWLDKYHLRFRTMLNWRRGGGDVKETDGVAPIIYAPRVEQVQGCQSLLPIPQNIRSCSHFRFRPVNRNWSAGGGRYVVLQGQSKSYAIPRDPAARLLMCVDIVSDRTVVVPFSGDTGKMSPELSKGIAGISPWIVAVSDGTVLSCWNEDGPHQPEVHEYIDQWSLPDLKHIRRFGSFATVYDKSRAYELTVQGAAAVDGRLVVWVNGRPRDRPHYQPELNMFVIYDVRDGSVLDRHVVKPEDDWPRVVDGRHPGDICAALCLLSPGGPTKAFLKWADGDSDDSPPFSVAPAPDTNHLVIAAQDVLHVWSASTGKRLHTLKMGCEGKRKRSRPETHRQVMVMRPPAQQPPNDTFVVWCCRCRKHREVLTVLRLASDGSLERLYERRVACTGGGGVLNLHCATPWKIYYSTDLETMHRLVM